MLGFLPTATKTLSNSSINSCPSFTQIAFTESPKSSNLLTDVLKKNFTPLFSKISFTIFAS